MCMEKDKEYEVSLDVSGKRSCQKSSKCLDRKGRFSHLNFLLTEALGHGLNISFHSGTSV